MDTSSLKGSRTTADFEAFMERFENEVYNAESFPRFWEPNEPLVNFCWFKVPNVGVSFLIEKREHHDFIENFKIGSHMGIYLRESTGVALGLPHPH